MWSFSFACVTESLHSFSDEFSKHDTTTKACLVALFSKTIIFCSCPMLLVPPVFTYTTPELSLSTDLQLLIILFLLIRWRLLYWLMQDDVGKVILALINNSNSSSKSVAAICAPCAQYPGSISSQFLNVYIIIHVYQL